MTVNDGDRNDSEKNEGRLCQNCDPAEGGGGCGDAVDRNTATTGNYDYDEIGEVEASLLACAPRDVLELASPDERMEVDNSDNPMKQEVVNDHDGVIGRPRKTE